MQRPKTIKEGKTALALIVSLPTHTGKPRPPPPRKRSPMIWCDYHGSYGYHKTAQCRSLQSAEGNRPPPFKNEPGQHPPRRGRGIGDYHGQGRGRGRGQRYAPYNRNAYAAYPPPQHGYESLQENEEIHRAKEAEQHEHNAIKPDDHFDFYLRDSVCHPSYTKRPQPHHSPTRKPVTLPDGKKTHSQTVGATTLTTTNGHTFHIPELKYMPTFSNNLLSIAQITRQNNGNLLLTLVKTTWLSATSDIIITATRTLTGYALPVIPKTKPPPHRTPYHSSETNHPR